MVKKDDKLLIGTVIVFLFVIGVLLVKIYVPQINITQNNNLIPIFLTGLLTGGLTCLAVQGGLLASTLAMQEEEKLKSKTKKNGSAIPILAFLVAKLIAYTIFGVLLGWFGSLFQLSLTTQIIMQTAVIVFMLGTAGNILEVHPVFRYFAIQPPRFLMKLIRNQSKSKSIFAPAFLGALTIFIPCGTTQAMMALAIGSGSPLTGAAIMFAFILGTTPLFFVLGYFATRLGDVYQKRFMKVAAIALILLAIFNLRNTLGLAGVNINLNLSGARQTANNAITENPVIEFLPNGYSPNNVTVRAGSNVKLTLKNTSGAGCISSFVIPKFSIQRAVPVGTSDEVDFTAPTGKGQIAFMCGMGMYRGVINYE